MRLTTVRSQFPRRFVAKGFEEPVRVYEVSWRDG